jgi:hypothetical protein
MEKVTLKLHEFYSLAAELNGVVNNQTGEVFSKGLLAEKIKLSTKYWLTELTKKVTAEKEAVEKLKEDLIKKYGTEDENSNVSIPMYINVVTDESGEVTSRDINPKFVEFQNEFNALLQEEKEIEYKEFKLSDFDSVESDGVYVTFFKLVKPE